MPKTAKLTLRLSNHEKTTLQDIAKSEGTCVTRMIVEKFRLNKGVK